MARNDLGVIAVASAALVFSSARCGSSSPQTTAPSDAGVRLRDAGTDSGVPDGAGDPPDAGSPTPADAGAPADAGQVRHDPPPLLDGGRATETLASEDAPDSLALDATTLYWTDRNPYCNGACDVQVRSMPKSGGAAATLATVTAESLALTVDDGFVYFGGVVGRAACGRTACTPIWKVYRVPKAGGNTEELAGGEGNLDQLAVGTGAVFVTGVPEGHTWSEYGVVAVPKDGTGAPSMLAAGQHSADVLFASGTVLWSVADGIRAVSESGGTPAAVVSVAGLLPTRLEADAQNVYFVAGASLWTAPRAGGAPRLLWQGDNGQPVTSLAVQNGEVFWTQNGCIAEVAVDGSGAHCLEEATVSAREVRADDVAVYGFEGKRLVRIRR